jgi:putative transposase
MRASRFSEEQIIGILREHERGEKTAEVCWRHGISDATFYIYGRLPRGKKVSGSWSGDDRLQTSIRRHHLMVRPNGISAHTRLNKWSASRAIIKVRV